MSVIEFLIVAFTCFISVQLVRAFEGPILHSGCNEYEDASQPTQLPHPNDCNKFYKCSGGYAFTLSCPKGLHWSPKFNRCDFPAVAGCNAILKTTSTSTTPSSSSGNGDKGGIIVLECPIEEDPSKPTHLPYPGDCTKFFKCRIGQAYPLNCPMGLHWSMALSRCEWPGIAKCAKIDVTTSTQLTASTLSLASTPVPAATPEPTLAPTPSATLAPTLAPTPSATPAPTPAPSSTPPTTAPTEPPNLTRAQLNSICKNVSSAYLPHPGTCRRYIQCFDGMGRILICSGNLFFNTKIEACSRTCG